MPMRSRRASSWPPQLPLRRRLRPTWRSCGDCWPRRRLRPRCTRPTGRRWRRRWQRLRPPPRRGERGLRPRRRLQAVRQRPEVCLRRCPVHPCHQHRRRTAVSPLLATVLPPLPVTALPPLPAWAAATVERQRDSSWPSMRRRRALALVPFPPARVSAWRPCTLLLCRPRWRRLRRAGLPHSPHRRPTTLCRRVRLLVGRRRPQRPPHLPPGEPKRRRRGGRRPRRRRPHGSQRVRKAPQWHWRWRARDPPYRLLCTYLQQPRCQHLDWLRQRHLQLPLCRRLGRPRRRSLQRHLGRPQRWRHVWQHLPRHLGQLPRWHVRRSLHRHWVHLECLRNRPPWRPPNLRHNHQRRRPRKHQRPARPHSYDRHRRRRWRCHRASRTATSCCRLHSRPARGTATAARLLYFARKLASPRFLATITPGATTFAFSLPAAAGDPRRGPCCCPLCSAIARTSCVAGPCPLPRLPCFGCAVVPFAGCSPRRRFGLALALPSVLELDGGLPGWSLLRFPLTVFFFALGRGPASAAALPCLACVVCALGCIWSVTGSRRKPPSSRDAGS